MPITREELHGYFFPDGDGHPTDHALSFMEDAVRTLLTVRASSFLHLVAQTHSLEPEQLTTAVLLDECVWTDGLINMAESDRTLLCEFFARRLSVTGALT